MELILIGSGKLKIMMTPEDMAQYDLKYGDIDYDSTETRRAFWSILDEAKHKTGFDAASDRVFVQLYPSKEGGCEMYVTKIGEKENAKGLRLILPDDAGKTRREIYSFERLEWLAAVCGRLLRGNYRGESSAYYDPANGRYFLSLNVPQRVSSGFCPTSFIKEYGKNESYAKTTLYIAEYCKCICVSDAVQFFSDM